MSSTAVRHRSRTSLVPTADHGAVLTKSADPKLGWAKGLALKVEYRALADVGRYANNARTHSKKQVEQIAASIRQFGFVNPIRNCCAAALRMRLKFRLHPPGA